MLILSSHLRLGLPSSLFALGIPTKILYARGVQPLQSASHIEIYEVHCGPSRSFSNQWCKYNYIICNTFLLGSINCNIYIHTSLHTWDIFLSKEWWNSQFIYFVFYSLRELLKILTI
jgi:hypothetical protein